MRAVRNWAVSVFILTFLVIIAGAVVRTTQSGMGCPDWPRCFGKWIPPTDASQLPADFEKYLKKQDIDHSFNAWHTWIEYINRLVGALLGVFAVIQVLLIFRRRHEISKTYRLAIAFLALVILTGLFGALVVKLNLAHASVSVHLFFALLLLQIQLALMLSIAKQPTIIATVKQKQVLYSLLVLIIIQIVLGTYVRIYIDDVSRSFNFTNRESWLDEPPILFYVHRSFSVLLLILSILSMLAMRNFQELKKYARLLFLIILLAAAAGVILNYFDFPAFAQPIHLLLAASALTVNVYMILRIRSSRLTSPID